MMEIQSAAPLTYNGTRYFKNDFPGLMRYLWNELHQRAGGAKRISKPKCRVIYTANLRGFEHFYDTYMVMEADFEMEGEE